MLVKERVTRFANRVFRSRAGIWTPEGEAPVHNNVLLILGNRSGKRLVLAHNIVTNDGDTYYAQKAVDEAPTNSFANLYLSSVDWSPAPAKDTDTDDLASVIAGAEKAPTANYPQTDDPDADNTGAGVDIVTWKYEYTKGDFNDPDIDAGAIAAAGVTSWGANAGVDPVLTAFDLTAFEKTADDTLKVFVNHQMAGV